ncbi:MAG TPA: CusA/CzcA family heavy metal efflux RND transporter [Armatimonadetes bacterium]|jgi:cobalt-zinc-cadmium resistance protein CzcA|nr:CusA/CzcA family heavy metal efflux RND transporter [Armatimonadota bacterium]
MEHKQAHGGLIDRLIHLSFRQQAVVGLTVALAVLFGIVAYQQMPRNVYPDITIPVFTIVTENEAMAAEEVEMAITRPMEAAMNGLSGVLRVRSQTTQGLSSVVVEFGIETEFWRARQSVTERMSQVAVQLPPGTDPPALSSATTRLAEVYELAVEGDLSPLELREFAEWQLRYSLLNVPGVAEVLNMGGLMRQFRVTIDPNALRSYGLQLADIKEAITGANENAAGGFISTGPTEYTVRGIGRFNSVEDIRQAVVAERKGTPIFLRHVAEVEDSHAIRRGIASKDGRERVVSLIIKQPEADTVKVVQGIEQALENLEATLPSGVRIVPYYDQTHLIEASLDSVTHAIMVGALLVIIVLLALLGNLRSTLIVALSLPLSVIIAGVLMRRLGVGLNTMSLGGLAIAVGIMVDASIIMIENIYHRFHQSRANLNQPGVRQAVAHKAAIEVGRPIAFATLIIVAVFLPLFMMGGIEGLLLRPLAVTVSAAMLVALALSLTLTPVLGLRLLRPSPHRESDGEVAFVRWLKGHYAPLLEWTLRHRWPVIGGTVALLILSFLGLAAVGRDFMPKLDEGAWVISTVTPAETSLEENDRITSQIERLLAANPDIAEVVRRNGRSERAIGCVLPVNSGEIIANLKPRKHLSGRTSEILANVREQIEHIPGVAVAFTQPLQLKIDESLEGTPAPLQVKLFGPDIAVLAQKGAQIESLMTETRGLTDVKMDQVAGIPQVQVQVDREAAARYGISVAAISELVSLAVGGEELTQVWQNQRSYGVFVRFPETMRSDPAAISELLVDAPSGAQIPLSQVANVTLAEGPNVIWREAMNRRLSINAGLQGRDLGSVVEELRAGLQSVKLPDGYYVVFGGQYQNQQRAMKALLLAGGIALVVVFTLLFLALDSAPQALIILATVPSAFIGGVGSLLISGETLNVSSAVGFIALFGIAVQNSLVLLTQTREFLAEGHTRDQAIRLASIQRLRPKLMTASCTMLGVLPILLSGGVGAEIEKPLAVVMIGGLVTSTLFTLLVLPAVYLAAVRLRRRLARGPLT